MGWGNSPGFQRRRRGSGATRLPVPVIFIQEGLGIRVALADEVAPPLLITDQPEGDIRRPAVVQNHGHPTVGAWPDTQLTRSAKEGQHPFGPAELELFIAIPIVSRPSQLVERDAGRVGWASGIDDGIGLQR